MNLQHRSYKAELLDGDNIPFAAIRQNMAELDVINTRLGGHQITIGGLKKLLGNRKQIHVCEIGCGGGDNLVALKKWCSKKGIEISFTGIDIKDSCIAFARERMLARTNWIVSDYRTALLPQKPDIIFSSLFCHHFTNEQLIEQLQWMQRNSHIGFFINDLHRHPLAYHSISILTKLFSRSYLVKNDAPLSVARGFKQKEWENVLQQAGIVHATIQWKWAFRWLITVKS